MEVKNLRTRLLRTLSKAWVIQRLRHIDLSVVPIWLCPNVSTASRYQHSLGVGRLSLLITDGTKHNQLLLTAAAVLHDVGNGPFPHISDTLMEKMLGFNHEGAVKFAFENSPIKDELVLKEYGLELEEVSSILKGEHYLSPFLVGFPDLDNADNVYRFIMTIPNKPLGEASYHPSEIASSMSLCIKEQEIPEEIRSRWFIDRERGYKFVWDDRLNMIGWTMLGRSMRILMEELSPRFFRMTNKEAFHIIRLKLPKLARGLKDRSFNIVFDRSYRQLRGEARKLSNITNLREIEDELCRETGLEDWFMGLTVDQPTLRERSGHWRVRLIVNKGNKKLKPLLEDILSTSKLLPQI